jgi:hypothetical protein
MSHVHRLRFSDRSFFVTVNLRRAVAHLVLLSRPISPNIANDIVTDSQFLPEL